MFLFGLGLFIGTFLGSLVDCLAGRSLTGKSFWGRSCCGSCKKKLSWYDLFPVFSYLSCRGRCRRCKSKIPLGSFLVEVLVGFLVGILFYLFIPGNFLELNVFEQLNIAFDVFLGAFAIAVLVAIVITDLKKGLIPDRITYPAIVIALIFLVVVSAYKVGMLFYSLMQSPLGKYLLPPQSDYFLRHALYTLDPLIGGIGSALGLGIFFGGLIILTRGKGMGGGDFKLAIFLGLVFGFPQSLIVIMLSFLLGSVVGVGLIFFGKKKFGQTIPFGPFLASAGIITIFWGKQILDWYLNLKFFYT